MDTIQLTPTLRKDNWQEVRFKACIPQTSCLQPASCLPSPIYHQCGYKWQARLALGGVLFHQEGEFFDSYGSPPSKYSGTFATFF